MPYNYYLYVIPWGNLYGPYTFREAMTAKENYIEPTIILKEVVDRNGKEVK